MDKFLQQFKDNLENQPAPEFDEQDWADMQQHLDQHDKDSTKPINYWAWTTVTLLLMIVGSNSLVLGKLSIANQQINHLESIIDTLVQTKIILRTDTIYQFVGGQFMVKSDSDVLSKNELITTSTKGNSNILSKRTFTNLLTFNPSNRYSILPYAKDVQRVSLLTPFSENTLFKPIGLAKISPTNVTNTAEIITSYWQQRTLAYKTAETPQKKDEPNGAYTLLDPIEVNTLSFLKASNRTLPSSFETPTVSIKRKKSIRQVLYPMRPKGIEVGISYGMGMSLAEHHNRQNIKQWEINPQIKFSPAIRLWIAVNYQSLSYESTKMGTQYGVPELIPPMDNFEFDEARFDQHILSFSTGLQYHFQATKKWQPFIGMGFGFSTVTRNSINYRFEEPGMPNPNTVEFKTVIYENASNLPFGLLKTGVKIPSSYKKS